MRPALSRRVYSFFIQRFLPQRFHEPTLRLADHFMDGLASLRSPRDLLMIFFTSMFIWLTETVKYWFVMHAFNFEVSFFVLMLMTGVVNLATTLPARAGLRRHVRRAGHQGAGRRSACRMTSPPATRWCCTRRCGCRSRCSGFFYLITAGAVVALVRRGESGVAAEAERSNEMEGRRWRDASSLRMHRRGSGGPEPPPRIWRGPDMPSRMYRGRGHASAGWRRASATRRWDWQLEKFYHHWFQTDNDMLGLIDELGLRDQVLFPRPKTSMWSHGKTYLFDNPGLHAAVSATCP